MKPRAIGCLVVGDGAVGKTCLLIAYKSHFAGEDSVDGTRIHLELRDAWGPEEYTEADVILLTYSVVSPVSFDNILTKWIPEIRDHCPETPILLCGTKIDLRDNAETLKALQTDGRAPISRSQGDELAKKIKAYRYLECSALTQSGLRAVFDQAVLAVIKPTLGVRLT